MIGYIFFVLAAAFKAVADTLEHHFETSVFKKLNLKWWNPDKSGDAVKLLKHTKYRLDAWHLSNSLMIVFFVCAGIFHKNTLPWYLDIPVIGTGFNIVFNTLYNKILRRK